eukprot:TRINITY_DN11417_c0_g1_i1.p1 TRINITY_DN11417_c0_g1~~TRINITY_DN11417_c0_g1_i1.p1  ORF type:complete len:160 (-),score=25.28 TRINITY_DN11417_c0_g1_i1:24-503(-)
MGDENYENYDLFWLFADIDFLDYSHPDRRVKNMAGNTSINVSTSNLFADDVVEFCITRGDTQEKVDFIEYKRRKAGGGAPEMVPSYSLVPNCHYILYFGVKKSGSYKARIYVNGFPVIERPLEINGSACHKVKKRKAEEGNGICPKKTRETPQEIGDFY